MKSMKSMLRMTPRMKLMHGFVQYVHCFGLRDLEREEREAKEERSRKAKARRLAKEMV